MDEQQSSKDDDGPKPVEPMVHVNQDQEDKEVEDVIPVVEATPVVLFQTTIRHKMTPYLPPPVVMAMRRVDPQLEPYIGPEPSITIMGSLFLALLLWQVVVRCGGSVTALGRGRGKAIQGHDDDDDEDLLLRKDTRYFDATILLCGPCWAGKTSIFYRLTQPITLQRSIRTVKSVKSNIGYIEGKSDNKTLRLLDVPGHWGPTKVFQTVRFDKERVERIVVVVDSTQPVAGAADYLYPLLLRKQQPAFPDIPILVACHKSKAPKAKNFRRIKLQLRTELERLDKLTAKNKDSTMQPIDWSKALQSDTIGFCSSSCDPLQLTELKEFCLNGRMPSSS